MRQLHYDAVYIGICCLGLRILEHKAIPTIPSGSLYTDLETSVRFTSYLTVGGRQNKIRQSPVEMWWHMVTHWRGSEGGNWRMEWVASTLHTTSEHGVSSITTADAHTSAASSRLNW
jgi:hypothetical protein